MAARGETTERAAQEIVAMIQRGEVTHTGRLPPERELVDLLRVSRSTVRTALGLLREAGVVLTTRGRSGGTFASTPNENWPKVPRAPVDPGRKLSRRPGVTVGVPTLVHEQGFSGGVHVLRAEIRRAPDRMAEHLDGGHPMAVLVERLRTLESAPISWERAWFPHDRFPHLLSERLGGSLYGIVQGRYGVMIESIVEEIEVVRAGADRATMLDIDVSAPVLAVERFGRDGQGRLVEYSEDWFRADRTRLRVDGRRGVVRISP